MFCLCLGSPSISAALKHPRTPTNPSLDYPSANSDHMSKRTRPMGITDEVVTIKGSDSDAVVPWLMVAGEAACASVHGANRLSANSLLDIVVISRACANRVAEIHKPGEKQKPLPNDAGDKSIAWLDKIRNSNGSLPTSKIRLNMQRIMQNNAAMFRTHETLEEEHGLSPYSTNITLSYNKCGRRRIVGSRLTRKIDS